MPSKCNTLFTFAKTNPGERQTASRFFLRLMHTRQRMIQAHQTWTQQDDECRRENK